VSRLIRRSGLTWLGVATLLLWLLVAAAIPFLAGVLVARADEPDDRYTPATRSPRQAVVELAERHFPPDRVAWAVATAWCESRFDLFAYSSGYDPLDGYWAHIGAFQISEPTWAATAWRIWGDSLWNPEVNFAMAAWILDRYGPSQWPYCGRRW